MRFAFAEVALAVVVLGGVGCRDQREVARPPVVVKRSAPPVSWPAFQGTRERLAWIAETDGVPQVVVEGTPVTVDDAHFLSAVSADGLYVTRSARGLEQLLLLRPDGGTEPLGRPSARAQHATVAHGVLLYESGEHGLSNLSDGVHDVLTEDTGVFAPSLAPDGTWFAFVSSREGDAEIYRAALDGGVLQRLTAFHREDVAPQVSPDGQWVAFISNREGQDRVFLVRADGRGTRRLHTERDVDDGGALEPAEADVTWAPDSKFVVYSARERGGPWQLFRVEVASGRRERLTDGTADERGPTVGADGRVVWVSMRDGDAELYLREVDGGTQRLTHRPGADWFPRFIPRVK